MATPTQDGYENDPPCTRGFFAKVLAPVVKAIGDKMKAERAKLDARNADLQAIVDKNTIALESAERRLSRHAEHLARLETRLKAVEK